VVSGVRQWWTGARICVFLKAAHSTTAVNNAAPLRERQRRQLLTTRANVEDAVALKSWTILRR